MMTDSIQVWWVFPGDRRDIPSLSTTRTDDVQFAIQTAQRHAASRRPDASIEIVKIERWRHLSAPLDAVEVSDRGGIRHFYKGLTRTLKTSVNDQGYVTASIFIKGQGFQTVTLHRLVALAFLPPPLEEQTQVDHLDGDKSNNTIGNLEWVTPSENVRRWHAHRRARNAAAAAEDEQS